MIIIKTDMELLIQSYTTPIVLHVTSLLLRSTLFWCPQRDTAYIMDAGILSASGLCYIANLFFYKKKSVF